MDLEAVREARQKAPMEKTETEHALREARDRPICSRCRRCAVIPAQRQAPRVGACISVSPRKGGGQPSPPSHSLWASGQPLWCYRCGRHAEAQVKGLHAPREPPTQWGRRCIRNLTAGKHPKKNDFVGMPFKVDLKGVRPEAQRGAAQRAAGPLVRNAGGSGA